MNYSTFFGRPLEDWKRDFKDFADNIKEAASEAASDARESGWDCGAGKGWKFKFEDREGGFGEAWHPRYNRYEDGEGRLVFEFLLPGFSENDLSLSFKGDRMILRARLPEGARRTEGRRYMRQAFQVRDIDWREYQVPAERYDQSAVKALLKNGVLTVTIPAIEVSEAPGAIKIEIVKEGN